MTHKLSAQGIESFTFSATNSNFNSDKIADCIKKNGIAIITDYINPDLMKRSSVEMEGLVNKLLPKMQFGDFGNTDGFFWQKSGKKLLGYAEKARYPIPVIDVRNKDRNDIDGGMIDFFKIDEVINSNNLTASSECINMLSSRKISEIIKNILGADYVNDTHLYYNDSVTNTRKPHCDNYENTNKIFIYLTDVNDLDDGPYCFVPGSYLLGKYLKREQFLNRYFGYHWGDNNSMQEKYFIKCLGKAGTIIISNQSGVHYGYPQKEGRKRIAFISACAKSTI